jgi:hypothetical protein
MRSTSSSSGSNGANGTKGAYGVIWGPLACDGFHLCVCGIPLSPPEQTKRNGIIWIGRWSLRVRLAGVPGSARSIIGAFIKRRLTSERARSGSRTPTTSQSWELRGARLWRDRGKMQQAREAGSGLRVVH